MVLSLFLLECATERIRLQALEKQKRKKLVVNFKTMTKINFSLECDEVLRTTAFSETELFNGEKAKGKKVLIIDPVTNIMQVAYCREPKTENRNYPIVNYKKCAVKHTGL